MATEVLLPKSSAESWRAGAGPKLQLNLRALRIIRIGFRGILYYSYNKEPLK